MDSKIALEAFRAYKACHERLRKIGLSGHADKAQESEEFWRQEYIRLVDEQSSKINVE